MAEGSAASMRRGMRAALAARVVRHTARRSDALMGCTGPVRGSRRHAAAPGCMRYARTCTASICGSSWPSTASQSVLDARVRLPVRAGAV